MESRTRLAPAPTSWSFGSGPTPSTLRFLPSLYPFPPPAHRTGRADLPHPALLPSSHFRPQREAANCTDHLHQSVLLIESHVRVALSSTRFHSMLLPHPPAQPATGVLLHHLPGCCDIAEPEVVRPAYQQLVQPCHLLLLVSPHRSSARQFSDPLTDRLNFLLGRGRDRGYITPARNIVNNYCPAAY